MPGPCRSERGLSSKPKRPYFQREEFEDNFTQNLYYGIKRSEKMREFAKKHGPYNYGNSVEPTAAEIAGRSSWIFGGDIILKQVSRDDVASDAKRRRRAPHAAISRSAVFIWVVSSFSFGLEPSAFVGRVVATTQPQPQLGKLHIYGLLFVCVESMRSFQVAEASRTQRSK